MKMLSFRVVALLFLVGSFAWSCNASKALKGGVIGTAAGGVIGGAIGDHYGNTAAGAIIGAAVGGSTGALIGRKMDKQAEELEQDLEGATVERVGEGILVTFESGLVFATNQSTLNAATKSNLDDMATTLQKYPDTNIHIEGHTDDTGADEYNLKLSKERANSVKAYLATKGVSDSRMDIEGYGESKPLVENDSEANRQKNRRVELAIYANEQMIKDAEDGSLDD